MYEQHIIIDLEMNPVPQYNLDAFKKLSQETIEIGAVKLDADFEIIDRFNCYVKPDFSTYIEPRIVKLTGIKTSNVIDAVCFSKALDSLANWIGYNNRTRIYSWSDTDLKQLIRECCYKNIIMPNNLNRWLDFQRVYPRIMHITRRNRRMALKDAAKYYGIEMNKTKSHSALYDAEVTTELLIPVLNREYLKQIDCLKRYRSNTCYTTFTLGEKFSDVFNQLLNSVQMEMSN